MRAKKIDLENFPTSESAQRMLAAVTPGFYDKSYVGKWLYQIMGLEFDEAERLIAEELPLQFFPETATWGLMYHEVKWGLPVRDYLSYDERRKLIYEKRDQRAPMTPYRMESIIKNSTGYDARISDIHDSLPGYSVDHPNRFTVVLSGDGTVSVNSAMALTERIKQSHTTFQMVQLVDALLDKCYVAAAPCSSAMSCTIRLPGVIQPRAVGATAYATGAAASARMMTEVKLPGIINPKSVSAQAYAAGRLAHTHETVTITIGGQTT